MKAYLLKLLYSEFVPIFQVASKLYGLHYYDFYLLISVWLYLNSTMYHAWIVGKG